MNEWARYNRLEYRHLLRWSSYSYTDTRSKQIFISALSSKPRWNTFRPIWRLFFLVGFKYRTYTYKICAAMNPRTGWSCSEMSAVIQKYMRRMISFRCGFSCMFSVHVCELWLSYTFPMWFESVNSVIRLTRWCEQCEISLDHYYYLYTMFWGRRNSVCGVNKNHFAISKSFSKLEWNRKRIK